MCGRTILRRSAPQIQEVFGCQWEGDINYSPSYNVCPSRMQPVLIHKTNSRSIKSMKWGFKHDKHFVSNARGETINKIKVFRECLGENRCVIFCDGYYEWKEEYNGKKIPYLFQKKDGSMMAFAGIYKQEKDEKTGKVTENYVIITTESYKAMSHVHHRMPVMLEEKDLDKWMNSSISKEEALELTKNKKTFDEIEFFCVSDKVNKTTNDSPDCIVKLEEIIERNKRTQPTLDKFLVKKVKEETIVKKEDTKRKIVDTQPKINNFFSKKIKTETKDKANDTNETKKEKPNEDKVVIKN